MTETSRTIAISRQRGSGGSYVGRLVAERLGLRYIDRELLRHAAEYLDAHREEKPSAARSPSWFERLGQTIGIGTADVGYAPPSTEAVYEGALFEIEKRLMLEIAAEQDAVIVGRGAAQTLKGRASVISIFLHAPPPWRAARAQQVYGLPDSRTAEQLVIDSDRDRGKFIRALCGSDWTDVRGYDMALDVATVGLDRAADLIVRAAAGEPEDTSR